MGQTLLSASLHPLSTPCWWLPCMTGFLIPILQMEVQSWKGQMITLHSPGEHSTLFQRHLIRHHMTLVPLEVVLRCTEDLRGDKPQLPLNPLVRSSALKVEMPSEF